VLIDGNSLFSGWVKIEGLPKVNVVGNDFHEGMITIETGGGAPLDQVTISKNRFYDAAQAAAIWQYAGSATIVGNHFVRANPEASDRAIDVGESHHGSVPVVANILDNVIVGFDRGIGLAGGAVATIRGNVLQYCEDEALSAHHDAQATIEENTFVNSRAGLKFWDQPQVTLRDNCIAGNTRYGVYTSSVQPGLQVDARENWWGHASGAKHPSNPGGRGDEATAPVLVSNPLLMDNCFSDSSAAVIGSQGGTVSSSAGHTSLAVPGGALSADTRVALRPMDCAALATMPAPPANGAGLRLFQVAARRVSDGVPLSTLSAQAELSVTYAEADRLGIDEDTLTIYRLDSVQQAASSAPGSARSAASWTPLSGELNADHNVLTGRTATLGTFAVLGEREEAHICLPLLLAAAR